MSWTTPQYSRRQVDAAGASYSDSFKSLAYKYGIPSGEAEDVDFDKWVEEIDNAFTIINNWRASHSYPLLILKKALHYRAKKVDENAIVAQRLKRLFSIRHKLERNPHMKLSQMQDIGGCRAVVRDVSQVDRLVDIYQESIAKNPHDRSECIETYNYIDRPKPDGYRSVHYVYKYRSKSPQHQCFNGLRVEVQLRSQLQHAWATAVETVSTFTGQALKSNIGDDDWKRFFALMGSAIALREERPPVPGTPEAKLELVEELRTLTLQLRIEAVLSGWSQAVQMAGNWPMDAKAFLLVLDAREKRVQVQGFRNNELARADEEYLNVEKANKDNPDVQAVLVSVDSISALQSAYPNYYLDTSAFLEAVRLAIA